MKEVHITCSNRTNEQDPEHDCCNNSMQKGCRGPVLSLGFSNCPTRRDCPTTTPRAWWSLCRDEAVIRSLHSFNAHA